jgi:hypothetical protein
MFVGIDSNGFMRSRSIQLTLPALTLSDDMMTPLFSGHCPRGIPFRAARHGGCTMREGLAHRSTLAIFVMFAFDRIAVLIAQTVCARVATGKFYGVMAAKNASA